MSAGANTFVEGGKRAPSRPKWTVWAGRVMSAIPVLMMLMSGAMKLTHSAQIVEAFHSKFGYGEGSLTPIGLVEVACVVVYLIPRTAVLGAVLMAAYLGGAVATHVRIGDPGAVAPIVLGVLAWGGLYLRDERIRALLPFVGKTQG